MKRKVKYPFQSLPEYRVFRDVLFDNVNDIFRVLYKVAEDEIVGEDKDVDSGRATLNKLWGKFRRLIKKNPPTKKELRKNIMLSLRSSKSKDDIIKELIGKLKEEKK